MEPRDAKGEVLRVGDKLDSLRKPGYSVRVERIEPERVIVRIPREDPASWFFGILDHADEWVIAARAS